VSLDKFYGFDFTADKCFAWQQKLIIGKNENKIRYLSLRNKRFTSMLKNGLGSLEIACLKYAVHNLISITAANCNYAH